MANSCYLDSNILIAYIQQFHTFHNQAIQILTQLKINNFTPIISPLCLDETIHILLRDGNKQKIPNHINITQQQITNLLKLPSLSIVAPPLDAKSQLKIFKSISTYKLHARDAYHLLIMKHHKINHFATFDSDLDLVFSTRTLKHFTTPG